MANKVECRMPCNEINGMPELCDAMQFGEAGLQIKVGTSNGMIIPKEFLGNIKAYPNGNKSDRDITK